jgi:uncharacterized protein
MSTQQIKSKQEFKRWKETTEESRKVVQAALDAASLGDSQGFINYFSDDYEHWVPGTTPISGRTKGIQEFLALLEKVTSYLDVMITLKTTNFIACGEWVVTESVGHSVTKKGKDYDNTYCHLWQVQNGKIVKVAEYLDTDLVRRVLCA